MNLTIIFVISCEHVRIIHQWPFVNDWGHALGNRQTPNEGDHRGLVLRSTVMACTLFAMGLFEGLYIERRTLKLKNCEEIQNSQGTKIHKSTWSMARSQVRVLVAKPHQLKHKLRSCWKPPVPLPNGSDRCRSRDLHLWRRRATTETW